MSNAQEKLPNRTRPETTGRELSMDEKRLDAGRLRDVSQTLERLAERLDALIVNVSVREALQTQIRAAATNAERDAEDTVTEIRRAVFERTGDTEDGRSDGRYEVGGRKFR